MSINQVDFVLQMGVTQLYFEHKLVLLHELLDVFGDDGSLVLTRISNDGNKHPEKCYFIQ